MDEAMRDDICAPNSVGFDPQGCNDLNGFLQTGEQVLIQALIAPPHQLFRICLSCYPFSLCTL